MGTSTRRLAGGIGLSALALAVAIGFNGCSGEDFTEGGEMTRLATVPAGAEITGIFLTKAGDLFFNAQHPADANAVPYNRSSIGALVGVDASALPETFKPAPVPATAGERQSFTTALGSYQIIAQEGETFDGMIPAGLGAMESRDGRRVVKMSSDPDFNAFVPANADSSEGYLFTNWEDRPGGMSRLHIQKGENGRWRVTDAMMLDFGAVDGTWVNCFGTLSPWQTPLTSEELYFEDTAQWNNPAHEDHGEKQDLAAYLGAYPNPYDYGYIVEITRPASATPRPVKRYALGRFSHENSVVMPDERTVYLSDDGTGTVFFKFVADEPRDLSAGTLYAAKATQDDHDDPARAGFDIDWIKLAHGNDAQIATWIEEYDGVTPGDYVEGKNAYLSDADIASWAAGEAEDDRAAFLESRKAAAAKGATAEFRKMEGVNIHFAGAKSGSVPFMYMAMSNFNETMGDDEGDIRLDATDGECGAIYRMRLDESFDVDRMEPVRVGGPHDPAAEGNTCAVDNVSEPDNLVVLPDGRVIVGEDTSGHDNNMLWVFDPPAER